MVATSVNPATRSVTPIRKRKRRPLVPKDWTVVQPCSPRADGTARYGVPSAETIGRTYTVVRDQDGTLHCPCADTTGSCWHIRVCNEYEVDRARAMWAGHEPARLVEFERELRGELYRMGDSPCWRVEIEYWTLVEMLGPRAA